MNVSPKYVSGTASHGCSGRRHLALSVSLEPLVSAGNDMCGGA